MAVRTVLIGSEDELRLRSMGSGCVTRDRHAARCGKLSDCCHCQWHRVTMATAITHVEESDSGSHQLQKKAEETRRRTRKQGT